MHSPCRTRQREEHSTKPNIYGLTHCSPELPIGDTIDILSICRDWLYTHFKQTDHNNEKITTLMSKTFYLR